MRMDLFKRNSLKNFLFFLFIWVSQVTAAFGAQVRIEAVLGEKTSSFSVREIGTERILLYSSSEAQLKKVRISVKNNEFIIEKVEEVIALSKKDSPSSDFSSCPRDHALVELVRDVKNVKTGRVCLLSKSPAAKVLLGLLEILAAEVL